MGRKLCRVVKLGLIVTLALAALVVVVPSAWGASFSPGRYVVKGRHLFTAGAGRSVSVFARPVVVSVDGCRSSGPSVRVARASVAVAARLTCTGIPGRARLIAAIRGGSMRGRVVRGRRVRLFSARLVATPGVLLRGRGGARALGAVRDTDKVVRHPASEVSRSGRARVLRTELVVLIAAGATVAQVDKALRAVGGRIEAAVSGSPLLVISISDPGSLRALSSLRGLLTRMRGVRSVELSLLPGEDELPDGFDFPPMESQTDAVGHLIAMRMPAAWNARQAIQLGERPLVIVEDFFGNGPLDGHVAVDPFSAALLTSGHPDPHGYAVTGIIAGDFKDDGSQAGEVTGAFPVNSRLLPIDLTSLSWLDILARLALTLRSEPGHLVVNTSLGENGGGLASADAGTWASGWVSGVRSTGLEQRMVQATSAGNDAILATNNSPWTAAALRADLRDPVTGQKIPPLSDTLVVENITRSGASDGYQPGCRWTGQPEPSNYGGTIASPGVDVYTNALGGTVALGTGTSFSSPEVAGLAEYLWSLAPDLSAQQVVGTILRTADPASNCPPNPATPAPAPPLAPHLDAYTAVLSLDQPGCFIPTCAPVRFAILDQNHDGRFDQADVSAFADHIFKDPAPTERDWSGYDLNGDGFTGGDAKAPFDLDTTGSVRTGAPSLTTVNQTVHDSSGSPVPLQFNEQAATDADVLCYYAYSNLYTPAAQNDQRDKILDNRCAPVRIISCDTDTDFEADADVGSDPTGAHKNTNFTQHPPQCSPPISASPPTLSASDSGTCNVPQQMPCSASSSAQASMLANASADSHGATMRASFTGNADASINTGGSAHADIDGDADVSFQVNKACSFSVSGTASSSTGPGGSATSGMSLGGGGQGTIFQVQNNGSDGTSGTLQPGVYSLNTSGVGDASAPFGDMLSSFGDVSASGFVTLSC